MSNLMSRLQNLFARGSKQVAVESKLAQRASRAVESILENEQLTAELSDAAAKPLIAWGSACAKMIAHSTAGLDDAQAQQAMSPRLRATRRLMRLVSRWFADQQEMDAAYNATQLAMAIERAAIVYDKAFVPPDKARRDAFVGQSLNLGPAQNIKNLRALLEPSNHE
jgi:hypothetical protein